MHLRAVDNLFNTNIQIKKNTHTHTNIIIILNKYKRNIYIYFSRFLFFRN